VEIKGYNVYEIRQSEVFMGNHRDDRDDGDDGDDGDEGNHRGIAPTSILPPFHPFFLSPFIFRLSSPGGIMRL
jgi:hypothetical protein